MGGYAVHYKKNKKKNIDEEEEEEEESKNSGGGGGGDEGWPRSPKRPPPWLEKLLRSEFFGPCEEHRKLLRKSEVNIFCVDCGRCMCHHCLSPPRPAPPPAVAAAPGPHDGHRLLQIRRYVYQNVIRVQDIENLLDCSSMQTYVVNSAKAVLLHPKTQSKPPKSSPGMVRCEICRRFVAQPNRLCSIACKAAEEFGDDIVAAVSDTSTELGGPSEPPLPQRDTDSLSPGPSSGGSPKPKNTDGRQMAESPDSVRGGPDPRRKRRRKGIPHRSFLL